MRVIIGLIIQVDDKDTMRGDDFKQGSLSSENSNDWTLDDICKKGPFEQAAQLVCEAEKLWDEDRINDAIVRFEDALKLDPCNADIWFNFAVLLRRAERYYDALDALARSKELEPCFSDVDYTTGNVYRSMGRLADAARSYQRCLELNPTSSDAANNLGLTLLEMGYQAEAESVLRNGLVIEPQDATMHRNLGVVLFESDRIMESVFAFRRATEIDPGYADAWAWLGDAYESIGLHGAAVEAHLRADLEGMEYPFPEEESYGMPIIVLDNQDDLID